MLDTPSDWVGVVAGVLVLLSFLFKNIKTIRVVNIAASIAFIIYGVMINPDGLPLIFTNGILIFVHLFYLTKIYLEENKKL